MARRFGWETIGVGTPYMTRGWIGRLRLHIFHRGDDDPDCHDHPWSFWTFPLVGYSEEVREPGGMTYCRVVQAFRLHYRPAEFAHRVIGPVGRRARIVTIVWRSGRDRAWGFWRDRRGEPSCWVPWRRYVLEGGKDAPCSEES